MSIISTQVVCHTSVKKYSESHNIEIDFKQGLIYMAQAYGENLVDIYSEDDCHFYNMDAKEFYSNFMTITWAENEDEFHRMLCPRAETIKSKFNELIILKQWQKKQQLQKQ